MKETFNIEENFLRSQQLVGYVPFKLASEKIYVQLGFKCGLEIHQQLKTAKKLFCRCPARIYQKKEEFDAEVIRHMRPTLSELGEYDGTALMEFKTKKEIIYHIKNETACTYDIDDTPPFTINEEALQIAIEIALLLKTSIVGELHITRKQYLDGSIPTGFQRTAIVGIEGLIPLPEKPVRIIQLSVEEDSCREVFDLGHKRQYTTDRLGIPLIETVTYPDLKTPHQAAQAAHYIRFLTRSTGKVRTGIGAARQDVNVSIDGGSRVEIKGVAHIKWIPLATHNEAFRQKALLQIKDILQSRVADNKNWLVGSAKLSFDRFRIQNQPLKTVREKKYQLFGVNLPNFKGILSYFTQPNQVFADELSQRIKVIACIETPNMAYSEDGRTWVSEKEWKYIQKKLKAGENDSQLLIWGPEQDIHTAIDAIGERCKLAFLVVPNETRKALRDGTTIFERVLPGPDRMYPDTDSPPIPINDEGIDRIRKNLPEDVSTIIALMQEWKVPVDVYPFILINNFFPLIKKIVEDFKENPVFVATLFGHQLKHCRGQIHPDGIFMPAKIYELFAFIKKKKLDKEIIRSMLPLLYKHPNMDFDSILILLEYKNCSEKDIISHIPELRQQFTDITLSKTREAENRWMMGKLRPLALGNIPMARLWQRVGGYGND